MKLCDAVVLFVLGIIFGFYIVRRVYSNSSEDGSKIDLTIADNSIGPSVNLPISQKDSELPVTTKGPMFVQNCGRYQANTTDWIYFKQKVLKNNEIFDKVNANPNSTDLTGWSRVNEHITNLIDDVGAYTNDHVIRIIEVGSWKGLSTTHIGDACRNFTKVTNKTCYVIAIDTWLGSPEHYETSLPEMKSNDLFFTFLNNIKVKGLDDIVYPLRLPSTAAAHVLHCFKIDAHIIYIDADHDYLPVLRDIETFYPLVKKNGIIFGDDYSWTGVRQAVHEYRDAKSDVIRFNATGRNWFMKKLKEDAKFL